MHQGPGHAHAERAALSSLTKSQAKQATVYVTLEPCCHHGRTPPCTDILIDYGIARVVYGMVDPNPQVAGQGVARLQAQGIACEQLELDEINLFYRPYRFWQQHQRPWFTAKLAISLDGKIAGVNGKRVQISDERTAHFTHQQRARADALLTTARTVLQDNPRLTVRITGQPEMAKPVYIIDRSCSLATHSHTLALTELPRKLVMLHDEQCVPPSHNPHQFEYFPIATVNGQLDWLAIANALGQRGLHHVWVEAGGRCFQSLHAQQLLNEAYLYVNPRVLGANSYDAFLQPMTLIDDNCQVTWQQLHTDGLCHLVWTP